MFPTISDGSRKKVVLEELAAAGIKVIPDTMVGFQGKGDKNGSLLDRMYIFYEREKNSYAFTGENILPFMVADIKRITDVTVIEEGSKIIKGTVFDTYSLKRVAYTITKELSDQNKA